jgi:murein DD-endopeptidase MepM/ murein hydrolase activator NlpD
MHTLNRILTCLVLMVVLLPPATFAVVSLEQKEEAKEHLTDAIGDAVVKYQQRSGVQGVKGKSEKVMSEQKTKLISLERKKLELREAVAKQQRLLGNIERKHGVVLASKEQIASLVSIEKRRIERMLKTSYLNRRTSDASDPREAVLSAVFDEAENEHRAAIAEASRMEFLRDIVAAEKIFWKLDTLTAQREDVLKQYWEAQRAYDKAEQIVERSEAQLEQIKTIMEEVHAEVLRMQGQLARIDVQLKAKAERELVKKGLIDAGSVDVGGAAAKPNFSWPVYGRTSAGFLNASYKVHFGVPHHGQDIVVGQGTPVASAADGVVFLVRDGGKTGYSYILIGHRDGYATLYGHISQALVKAGDEVNAGQNIALSGGTPGTHGAGPMTTGAHLHFEVIKGGSNIDPKGVLP